MPEYVRHKSNTLRLLLISAALAGTVLAAGLYWIMLRHEVSLQQEHLLITDTVAAKSQAIKRRLDFTLMATRMLEIQIRLNHGSRDDFDIYAKEILATVQGVNNIQLAPNGVITDIYPLPGNERAIGHNILQDDKRRDEARKAVSTRKMTLTGPFELVQGGVAVIGRQPVFVSSGQSDYFWGFASALIYLDELLKEANLEELEQKGFVYELSREEIGTGKRLVFAQSKTMSGHLWHEELIQVPNGYWLLKVGLRDSTTTDDTFLSTTLLAILTLVIFVLSFQLLKQPNLLRQQVQEATRQLSQLAFYDQLTGLANRQLLFEHLQNLLSDVQRHPSLSALLYIDLDNFKTVNDNLGHDAGDELLRQVARRLQTLTRESDISARVGGDEFAVLIRKLHHPKDAVLVADKILSSLSIPVKDITDLYPVSASIGIVLIPEHSSELADLFKKADQAMYQAKNNGKNRYAFHRPEQSAEEEEKQPQA